MHNAILSFQLSARRGSTILSIASTVNDAKEGDNAVSTRKKTRGSVLGDIGYATAYKLTKSTETYDTVNLSNNNVGRGIIQWINRFDKSNSMINLVAQNARLSDLNVRQLVRHLKMHPTIKRLDLR